MTDHSTEYTGEGRRRREMRMMSRCFTWYPIGGYRRTQYIPRFGGVLQECGELLGGSFTKLDYCPTCVVEKVWE